ncbi:MAG: DinB family protein [Fimbriimonadaceae bacterium]|nr:MAG: DinB family protein [Fimbriimonadaceae bacterium]
MDSAALIRAQLSSVRNELAESFPHITDEMLGYAPKGGMRTIHGQFAEILSTETTIIKRIRGEERISYPELEDCFLEIKTVAGLIEKLDEVRKQTLDILNSADERELARPVETSKDFASWLELDQPIVSEMLRFIARHESYHSGQLVSYLWAYGINPYDEN